LPGGGADLPPLPKGVVLSFINVEPPPLCPPFFLLRGYPSGAVLVLGRPPSTLPYL
jgi:hypothetical protein